MATVAVSREANSKVSQTPPLPPKCSSVFPSHQGTHHTGLGPHCPAFACVLPALVFPRAQHMTSQLLAVETKFAKHLDYSLFPRGTRL